MSTTIKSCMTNRTVEVAADGPESVALRFFDHKGVRTGNLIVTPADLLAALRAEGVLPEDDGLRERIEALIESRDRRNFNKTATDELRAALKPPARFTFPTGLGAVVEGESVQGGVAERFTHARTEYNLWTRESSGRTWTDSEIATSFTNLRTLSEGVEL